MPRTRLTRERPSGSHRRSALTALECTAVTLAALTWMVCVAVASEATVTGDRAAPEGSACGRPLARLAHAVRNPFGLGRLRAYLADRDGNVSAAVYDVNSGATYLYRRDLREQTASIVKVDILATLLHERQRFGGLTAGQEATAAAMIETSDNGAATTLWDQAGGGAAVAAFNRQAGLPDTAPNTAGYWGLTWTSARDQLELLRCVVLPNPLLDVRSRENEYELMRHVIPSQRWGVSAGPGGQASVALKNGWLPIPAAGWQVNSIGSVIGSGRRYLIAVLTSAQPTEGYGIATIERVSAAVWGALAPRKRSHRRHRIRSS